jgi:hypothetical protein
MIPLGVGKTLQKVWGDLVWCGLSNEHVLLRPGGVAMVLRLVENDCGRKWEPQINDRAEI